MNKEEFAISEKTYENYDGLKIKIVFSNLGRRYKKIGDQLYLMLEKEGLKPYKIEPTHITITYDKKTRIIKRIIWKYTY